MFGKPIRPKVIRHSDVLLAVRGEEGESLIKWLNPTTTSADAQRIRRQPDSVEPPAGQRVLSPRFCYALVSGSQRRKSA